ncbi:uncharacterized protein LDX57_005940 [Aspergillus melleus]|uniref:uncharacterized protein n=1 Tax=Aspergillus melleus TaxID=138277 RepID=UPI001E8E0F06|nr:uncharacterized protein LDX57_005940 [Aspergillus melleus]KAH8428237.1 hypothetical protein LDX57_005940 [Aspergillus melleus]
MKSAPIKNISDSEQADMEVPSSDNDEASQPRKKREIESESKPALRSLSVLLALSRKPTHLKSKHKPETIAPSGHDPLPVQPLQDEPAASQDEASSAEEGPPAPVKKAPQAFFSPSA